MNEPIDYDVALRELLKKKRQRRFTRLIRRIPDPRPRSPGQVMLLAVAVAIFGWLIPGFHVLVTIGLAILAFGFVTGMLQPRVRRVTWRNREIDLPPTETWAHRLYKVLYHHRS